MDGMRNIVTSLSIPGMPEWTGLMLLSLGLLCAAAFLLMPFSVFGVKARLEAIEVQLDEIQNEIRELALSLQEGASRRVPLTEDWAEPPSATAASRLQEGPRITPPVPPPPAWPTGAPRAPGRAEPKLDWPRQK
jgi:hypothetical protein